MPSASAASAGPFAPPRTSSTAAARRRFWYSGVTDSWTDVDGSVSPRVSSTAVGAVSLEGRVLCTSLIERLHSQASARTLAGLAEWFPPRQCPGHPDRGHSGRAIHPDKEMLAIRAQAPAGEGVPGRPLPDRSDPS